MVRVEEAFTLRSSYPGTTGYSHSVDKAGIDRPRWRRFDLMYVARY